MSAHTKILSNLKTLIATVESGPGEARWDQALCVARSVATGRPYTGGNAAILAVANLLRSPSTMWGTFRQWQATGFTPRGKGTGVTLCLVKSARKEDESGDEPYVSRFFSTFTVFPSAVVKDAQGNPWQDKPGNLEAEEFEIFDKLLNAARGLGVKVSFGGSRAYWSKTKNEIVLPPLHTFRPGFAALTLAHEVAHATSGPLSREIGPKGSEAYAVEEMIAEMAAAQIGAALGFESMRLEDHAKYVQGWWTAIKRSPEALIQAGSRAQAAANLVLLACSR